MDETEEVRKELLGEVNQIRDREQLEEIHGKGNVWDTTELGKKFEVLGFMAPLCVVRDRETGEKGSVFFTHSPRFYFDFQKA